MRKKLVSCLLFFCVMNILTSCGQSGALYLPQQPTQEQKT